LTAVSSVAQINTAVTVQLVSVSDGKPIPRKEVLVYQINPDTHMPIVEPGFPLKGTTGEDGKVSFSDARLGLASPEDRNNGGPSDGTPRKRLSKVLDLQVIYAGGGIQCSTGLFSSDEILVSGVVGNNRCGKQLDLARFKSVPGEVVIFVGKYHWWEAGEW